MSANYPIVEDITQAILAQLQTITVANGYKQDLTVQRPNKLTEENSPRNQLVYLTQDSEDREDPLNYGKLDWRQGYTVIAFSILGRTSEIPVDQHLTQMAKDIEKAVKQDPQWGGLAHDTSLEGSDRMTTLDGAQFDVVVVNFSVHYRSTETDPYSQ